LVPASFPTLRKYSQDVPAWVRAGKQDYIAPQIYWTLNPPKTNPGFSALLEQWRRWAGDRHVYAGIAVYKPEVLKEVREQIAAARGKGAEGESFFRYANVAASPSMKNVYAYPALVPPMHWKYPKEPLPPPSLAISESSPAVFQLEWTRSAEASVYVVYRSPAHSPDLRDPRNITALVEAKHTSLVDSIASPSASAYYYAVTSLNRTDDESKDAVSDKGSIREVTRLAQAFPEEFDLQLDRRDTTSGVVRGVYRLPDNALVRVRVVSLKQESRGKILQVLDDRMQPAGLHTLRFTDSSSDSTDVRLESNGRIVEKEVR